MSALTPVTQIEKQVRRIERDLTRVRLTLQGMKIKKRKARLAAVQKSIGQHLQSNTDPAQIIAELRRRRSL